MICKRMWRRDTIHDRLGKAFNVCDTDSGNVHKDAYSDGSCSGALLQRDTSGPAILWSVNESGSRKDRADGVGCHLAQEALLAHSAAGNAGQVARLGRICLDGGLFPARRFCQRLHVSLAFYVACSSSMNMQHAVRRSAIAMMPVCWLRQSKIMVASPSPMNELHDCLALHSACTNLACCCQLIQQPR